MISHFGNQLSIARPVAGIFFPQRLPLKIDGRSYSPKVLEKAMFCTARDPAYNLAAATLEDVGDIRITGRHLRNLAAQVGGELEREQDAKTDAYFNQPLPKVPTAPTTPIQLACVSVDGGRMQTRLDGGPNGVQQPHWRETKNALFMRMTGVQFDADPQPTLPECFQDRKYMKKLLSGISMKATQIPRRENQASENGVPKSCFEPASVPSATAIRSGA